MPDEARDADGRPPLAAILCLTAGFLCIAAAALLLILRPRPVEEAAAPTPPSPGFDARTRAVVPPVPQSPAPAEPESSPRALYGLSAVVGGLGLALDLVGDGGSGDKLTDGIANKLIAGKPLDDYELHIMVDVLLLHARLGGASALRQDDSDEGQ